MTTTTTTTDVRGAFARARGVGAREGGVSAREVRGAVHKALSTTVSMAVLERGEELQANGLAHSTLLPHIFHVGRYSYLVNVLDLSCECRGFRLSGGKVCKHIVAAGVQFMVNDANAGGIIG